jgi:hypothetical protein
VTGWGGNWLINVSRAAPQVGGARWADHLAGWVAGQIGPGSAWDGVFYDNVWSTISWKSADLDLQRAGKNSETAYGQQWTDDRWAEGMLDLMRSTRQRLGPDAIVLGNGPLPVAGLANGRFFESFPNEWNPLYAASGWGTAIEDYQRWHTARYKPLYYVIDGNAPDTATSRFDYQLMRFGLTSTLLGDGYFAFDHGVADHAQVWWYDEYSVDLTSGRPTGDASAKGYLGLPVTSAAQLSNGVWRRDFEHGIALVNPTDQSQTVRLERSYAHILGAQDPAINNGAVVQSVDLPSHDGVILLSRS